MSFADELVSECHYVPRLCEESIGDYFYSRADIERFQRIWKQIILQRIKQLENERQAEQSVDTSKRTHDDMSNNDEDHSSSTSSIAKRRCCTVEHQIGVQSMQVTHETVQVARSVSPVDDVDSR